MRVIWAKLDTQNHVGALFNPRLCLWHTVKTIGAGIIICITLFGSLHASQPMGLPTNVCFERFCGPVQQEIWNRFQDATGLKLVIIPSVYSGTCYHNSPAYNPHTPHFGGVLIDKLNGHVFFHGRFSFYKQTHPFADLSVEAARERFPEPYEVALYDMFAYAESSDSLAPFRYWFRQEADTNNLLLVGYFGYDHTILCAIFKNIKLS
jgi:hypothetical protein